MTRFASDGWTIDWSDVEDLGMEAIVLLGGLDSYYGSVFRHTDRRNIQALIAEYWRRQEAQP